MLGRLIMTAKLTILTGLLLMLCSSAFAVDAEPMVQAQAVPEPAQTAQAPQLSNLLAWQRVGSPIRLET